MKHQRKLAAVAAAAAVTLAGCSSSHNAASSTTTTATGGTGTTPASTGGTAATSQTINVGLLVDESGLAASGNKTAPAGVQAGIVRAEKAGYHIKLYTADTQTSPATALAGAQKLVEQDNVDVVLSQSSLMFAAAPWLTQHNIPVIGIAEDGSEWTTSMNMFSVFGALRPNQVTTMYGIVFKHLGATNIGAIGYSISPSSAESAEVAGKSAQAAGLKAGYVNASFPFGSTNVTPDSLAMKNAGIDGFTASVDPNTGFAFIQELRTLGVNLKAAILPDGYGGDLTQAGTDAENVAKGITFTTSFEPVEMQTAATKQIVADLKAVGVTNEPTYAEYAGYADIAMLVQALSAAGSSPTRASIQTALSGITSYDAWGLLGSHPLNVNDRGLSGMDNCGYYATWNGSAFQLLSPDYEPLCGKAIVGETVSAPA